MCQVNKPKAFKNLSCYSDAGWPAIQRAGEALEAVASDRAAGGSTRAWRRSEERRAIYCGGACVQAAAGIGEEREVRRGGKWSTRH